MATPADAFYRYLPPPAQEALLRCGASQVFRRREALLRQDEYGFHLVVLVSGTAKVVRSAEDGSDVVLAVRRPVDLLGEGAVFERRPRYASVYAVEDCTVRVVRANDFRAFIRDYGVEDAVLRFTLARLRESDDLRAELASCSVRQRMARMLLRLCPAGGTGGAVVLRLRQDDLAQAIGASRNAVVAELSALRTAGVLRTGRARIVIEDLDALRARGA